MVKSFLRREWPKTKSAIAKKLIDKQWHTQNGGHVLSRLSAKPRLHLVSRNSEKEATSIQFNTEEMHRNPICEIMCHFHNAVARRKGAVLFYFRFRYRTILSRNVSSTYKKVVSIAFQMKVNKGQQILRETNQSKYVSFDAIPRRSNPYKNAVRRNIAASSRL